MEYSSSFWWNFWVVVQALIVVGVVVALVLFVRWGRRKSALLEASGASEGDKRTGSKT